MGLRLDQLVGYTGDVSDLCQGILCHQFHFEAMTNIKGAGKWDIDVSKIQKLAPDVIVDYRYNPNAEGYAGSLKYAPQFGDLEALNIPMIEIQVGNGKDGFLEIVETMQRLAIALAGPPNQDVERHCDMMHKAMNDMISVGKTMSANSIRVMAAAIEETRISAIEPTDDPILIMLEELGVPMIHVNVNNKRGFYYEYIDFPVRDRNTAHIIRSDGGAMHPVDVWLYDGGKTRYHLEDVNITDPAWDIGQFSIWPSDPPFTYEQGARILNTILPVFAKAKRMHAKTDCTDADVSKRERLGPGSWACPRLDTKARFPSCPGSSSPSPSTSPLPSPSASPSSSPSNHKAKCSDPEDPHHKEKCEHAFKNRPEAELIADNCPDGCTFTPAVKATAPSGSTPAPTPDSMAGTEQGSTPAPTPDSMAGTEQVASTSVKVQAGSALFI